MTIFRGAVLISVVSEKRFLLKLSHVWLRLSINDPSPLQTSLKTSQFASSWYGGPEAKNSFSYKRSQREDYSASQISW